MGGEGKRAYLGVRPCVRVEFKHRPQKGKHGCQVNRAHVLEQGECVHGLPEHRGKARLALEDRARGEEALGSVEG